MDGTVQEAIQQTHLFVLKFEAITISQQVNNVMTVIQLLEMVVQTLA